MKRPFKAYKGAEPYVFVSYARKDAGFVFPELAALNREDIRIWYDEGIEPGLAWRDEVASAIIDCSLFLMFISPRSVASPVCAQELNFALSYDRPVLAIHIEDTQLPPGMELSLSEKQAILCQDYSEAEFREKLTRGIRSYLQGGPAAEADVADGPAEVPPSIAILPFSSRGDSEQGKYLSEGIADELIHGLSHVQGLRVVSGFSFRNQNLDVRTIGRRFKVGSVLDGSVQQAAGRIRIIVRLSNTGDGSMIWSSRYDQEIRDIFEIQDEVASAVLQALRVSLPSARESALDIGTQNVEAYEAYLLGTYEKRKDQREGYEQAIGHFSRAVEIDPAYSRAYYQLGICHWELTVYRGQDDETIARAEQAFEKAMELGYEPDVPWAHVRRRLHPELRPTQRELAVEALELIRNRDSSWRGFEYAQLGRCLGGAGLYQAAYDFLSKCPNRPDEVSSRMESVETDLLTLLPALNRFGEAIDSLSRRVENQPDDQAARQGLSMLYSRTRQFEKAQREIDRLKRTAAVDFLTLYKLFWQDRRDEARSGLDRVVADEDLPLRFKFWACALLGEPDSAIDFIEKSARRGAPVFYLRVLLHSALPSDKSAEVEAHPRFRRLLDDCGIDDGWRSELAGLANEVTGITGIYVDPND